MKTNEFPPSELTPSAVANLKLHLKQSCGAPGLLLSHSKNQRVP